MATVVTNVGEERVVDYLDASVSTTSDTPHWVGSGTGASVAAEGDTVIETETTDARANGVTSQPSADTMRVVGTITYGTSATIANAGTLTSSSAGTLFLHGDFTGVAVLVNDQIQFTLNTQIT